ncbi:glycosyltransferase family 4 protein [Sphingobacterium sp.]|uniref:glycosyltransferase family 4 protein n=1 Tax=Sphingobacterium sp. TaxID=341027 RepID=UPI0031E14D22
MKIAYISTYLPKECGIATFTSDLLHAVALHNQDLVQHVIAVADDDYAYPGEVVFTIDRQHQLSYIEAAEYINNNGYDCVILEHEYGIFGGNSGIYILSLINTLHIPLLVNLHTILEKPSVDEKAILIEIVKRASVVIVMSNYAITLLKSVYRVNTTKVRLIHHGVPEFHLSQKEAKEKMGLSGKKILLTFGFIGRNKGIETVIESLATVVKNEPDLVYLIVGKTHPNVLAHSGEEYREYLKGLVDAYHLEDHVQFVNSFVSQSDLVTYLSACDVYVTPYVNEAQITSGTLSYAIGAGAAVVSTPYWHAKELLADGRGVLVEFKNPASMATTLAALFSNQEYRMTLRDNARAFGKEMTWKNIGIRYTRLLDKIVPAPDGFKENAAFSRDEMPKFSWKHIDRLTNQVGILQHATYSLPNYKEGYCLDDNARALLLTLLAQTDFADKRLDRRISTYLSYIYYHQREDGLFHNFMSFQHNFLDEVGSEDSFGRTIWALGVLLRKTKMTSYYQLGYELFFRSVPNFKQLRSNRAIAYTILGIAEYLHHQSNDEVMIELMRELTGKLIREYEASSDESWQWFESVLAYDNAILPYALLTAYPFLNDETVKQLGLLTLTFLESITIQNGALSLVGNQEWAKQGKHISKFGQQPLDVTAMVFMYREAFRLTNKKVYFTRMVASFRWFLGENDLKLGLYDEETKGCCDGLESYGINRNQGAESTLCYYLAYIIVYRAFIDNAPDSK